MTIADTTMADALAEWFAARDATQDLKSAGEMAGECAKAVLDDDEMSELDLGLVPSGTSGLECDETWLADASPRFAECSPFNFAARSIHPAFPAPLLEPAEACERYIDIVMRALEAVMVDEAPMAPGDRGYEQFTNEPIRVPLRTYMQRIVKLARIEPACIILAGSYLGRLAACNGDGVTISNNNARRLVFVAMMVASKFLHDIPFTNKFWARISGTFPLADVNQMELDMLQLLEWDVSMSREAFEMFTGLACTAEF